MQYIVDLSPIYTRPLNRFGSQLSKPANVVSKPAYVHVYIPSRCCKRGYSHVSGNLKTEAI